MVNGLSGALGNIGFALQAAGAQDPQAFIERRRQQQQAQQQQAQQQQALAQLPAILGGTNIPAFKRRELGTPEAIEAERIRNLQSALGVIAPQQLVKQATAQAFPQQVKPVTLRPEERLVSPITGEVIAQAPVSLSVQDKLQLDRLKISQQQAFNRGKIGLREREVGLKERESALKFSGEITPLDLKKVIIPGFEIQEGILPTTKDVEVVKKSAAARISITNRLTKLKELTAEFGTEIAPTQAKSLIRQIRRSIQLEMKELLNLGVLNGPDLEILDNLIPDPTSLVNAAKLRGVTDTMSVLFSDLQEFVDQKVNAEATARGYVASTFGQQIERPVQQPQQQFTKEQADAELRRRGRIE